VAKDAREERVKQVEAKVVRRSESRFAVAKWEGERALIVRIGSRQSQYIQRRQTIGLSY
jgi:hypothetical protein